jgi:hypothetical protein
MSDVNDWKELNDEDKKLITTFVSINSGAVREMMRNKYPSLYIGRSSDEVSRGWLMIAGLSGIKDFISSYKK